MLIGTFIFIDYQMGAMEMPYYDLLINVNNVQVI